MQKPVGFRAIFLSYTSFVAICSLIIIGGMLSSPSEPGSSILFGLSLPRLVLAFGLLCAFIFYFYLFLRSLRDAPWTDRTLELWFDGGRFSKGLAVLTGVSLGLGWIGCFLPSYRAGFLGNYWTRIQPLMVFILCASIATGMVFIIRRIHFSVRDIKNSGTLRLTALLFVASLVMLGFMLGSRFGLYAPEDFWYGAGVPILTLQLMAAIFSGVLFLFVVRNTASRRTDVIVFILLFLVTAVVWAREPLQKSFLYTEPRLPNQALYPFADSAAFDAGSQFALIGQGIYIFNTPFNDRPLYLSLLVYLHTLFGQNYELLMTAQAVIFALLPGLIYLIGRSLNMRAVGFASAVIAMFRGINSIAASSMIDLANPKMILSDFPTAIGVALIILFTCEWWKQPERKWYFALWVGGAIGLTMMIRPHGLVILSLLPFHILLKLAPQWKRWITTILLIVLGVVAVTLPWELRNVARGGTMYRSIVVKVQDVIRTRYSSPTGEGNIAPFGSFSFQTTRALSTLVQGSDVVQDQPCAAILCFASNHFLHNTITSILVLPTSPILNDLRTTVKSEPTVWRADWQGIFTPSALFFFILNVFFIVVGISVAWKYKGLAGLTPLAIFVIYNMANSVARTSGGRYIVPADWIISMYYVIGVLFLLTTISAPLLRQRLSIFDTGNPEGNNPVRSPWLTTVLVFALLFVIGSTIPLSEKLHSPRYANVDITKELQEQETHIKDAGLAMDQLDKFLKSPGAEILVGRTLFPRSYKMGQGEVTFYFYPFTVMDFPRTGFFLIGPHGQDNILLPGGVPEYLPHTADALVIGCREENYVDALMVMVLDDSNAVYTRSPLPELTCPMKPPVCQDNTTCE